MNAANKFNQTITLIENMASDPDSNAREIGSAVASECGLQLRDMSTVFSYLLDRTLYSYIMERKLMQACRFLIENEKRDIGRAVAIGGYADQPSFTKAFKRQFGITPMEAVKVKDPSIIKEPVTWDLLSDNIPSHDFPDHEHMEIEKKMIFGVSEDAFNSISKAIELEAFYGLPKMFSVYAFDIFKAKEYPMDDCFRYAASLREYGGDFDDERMDDEEWMSQTPEERMRKCGDDEVLQTVFFSKGISVSIIVDLIDCHGADLDDLMKCTQNMLDMYPGLDYPKSMSFKYYLKAYEFYARYYDIEDNEDAYYDYISYIMSGTPIEYAFLEAAYRVETDKGIEDLCDYGEDYVDPLADYRRERLQELETKLDRWSDRNTYTPRNDGYLGYDPDNPGYDDW